VSDDWNETGMLAREVKTWKESLALYERALAAGKLEVAAEVLRSQVDMVKLMRANSVQGDK